MADGTNPASQFPNLPERIRGLERLSYNLWWSWHRQARDMFPSIDLQAWRESDHNPLRMLAILPQQTLDDAARDPEFLERFDAVMAEFDANIASQTGWFTVEYGSPRSPLA
jgi:starch phosphorylase